MVKPKKRLKPEEWFERGEQFELAAHAMFDGRDQEAWMPRIGIPHVVMRAFAVECYLKCLIELDERDPTWTHHLGDLFGKLKPADKQELSAIWKEKYEATIHKWNAQEKPKDSLAHAQKMPVSLSGILSACGDTFKLFRYGVEEGVAPFFLLGFPVDLREYASKVSGFRLSFNLHDRSAGNPEPQFVELKEDGFRFPASGWSILNPQTPAFQVARWVRGKTDPKDRGAK